MSLKQMLELGGKPHHSATDGPGALSLEPKQDPDPALSAAHQSAGLALVKIHFTLSS